MKIKDLIGYRLEKINNEEIIISKNDKLYELKIEQDDGGCCGYNDLETTLLISDNSKPVITNIEYEDITKNEDWGDSETIKITFFGENKEIATIKSKSSSGSGWCYGACVTVKCKELSMNEVISQW